MNKQQEETNKEISKKEHTDKQTTGCRVTIVLKTQFWSKIAQNNFHIERKESKKKSSKVTDSKSNLNLDQDVGNPSEKRA